MKILLISAIILFNQELLLSQLPENKDYLKDTVNNLAITQNFNGVILISEGDTVLFEGAYGLSSFELDTPISIESIFNIASLTKHFTGAAILRLQENGLLTTNDKLIKYLPDFPNADNITIHHLLTHSSGINNYNTFLDYWEFAVKQSTIQDVINWIKDKPIEFNPGEKFSYSNSNYAILAYIIEKVSTMSYDEFLQQNFFIPLEMNNTGNFTRREIKNNRVANYDTLNGTIINARFYDLSFKVGSGSLYSTVRDLHKWYLGLTKHIILNKKSFDMMFSRYENGYGYGLGRGRNLLHVYYEHQGISPGVEAYIAYFISDGYFLVILSNVSDGKVQKIREMVVKIILNL